ncbi:dephospho-CoA kinase [Deinococcus metallilatus]|uniref:Dephospho-CoA kinase n=1 Tax=Deinococcus metallilatus TaxID=1211322 RepID=A0AAJ5JYA3_9DEIO|nr:dephospho-CoA kinase [Deinococcus metallilatus]MBB5295230.1 dephospho-CoA kinase [Deinococcus metallilatus]QBY08608.1 dephospho-CoA kinase [Deinococcus metallilatus]RXJ10487.1 dephospho-CoA kinase [Deinococcus metallilatus]TLK26458.1 dephospho-CoA kinase [Deinococcus metallilatus]GMA15004.1 dephospho-CoA kinase [Deinococcus metallilatus]
MTSRPSHPRRLGLTGSIGAGKSTVAGLLRAHGLTVLDADAVAREVTHDPAVLREIGAAFPGVVREGVLDRAALAEVAFADPARLAVLNAITHPRVRQRMLALEQAAATRGEGWIVQDVPLLFEGGLEAQMDAVLVVDAPLALRLARVTARSGLSAEEVLARDARQMPADEKRKRATFVLDNSGDLAGLERQVDAALRVLGIQAPVASSQEEESPSNR